MNQTPSTSTPHMLGATDRYRVADLELFPAGDNLTLVHAKNNQSTRFLPREIVDLLLQCREFRTLDDHLQAYCRGRQVSAVTVRALRRELQKLTQNGCLISRSGVLQALLRPVEQVPPSVIASVGFPTCDRVQALQRGMTSYIENCRRFERTNDFVVVDDSASPDTRDACRQMLRTLKSQHGVNIFYAGLDEKVAFAKKLTEVGNLPADVVHFACVGDKQYGVTTVGANRNALLLHTVGDQIFSADDDTVCRIAVPPGQKDGVAFSSEEDLLEPWFYPDRGIALRSVHCVEQDILALHEQWLGKEPLSALAAWDQNCEVSCVRAGSRWLRLLETRSGRIVLTSNGTVGDCAWDNPHYYLFQRGDTFRRLTSSVREYQSARASREVAQSVSQITITERANPVFAMCMGLDNRDLLPPFTPIGRGEEVVFGAVASKCLGEVYASHLPWVLPHIPPQQRSFPVQHMFAVGPRTLLWACINSFNPMATKPPAEQLRKLGQHLEEVGCLSETTFEEILRSSIWRSMSSLILELEERLQNGYESPPAFWMRDARSFIELARQSALTPVDQLYELEGGRGAAQLLIFRFGQVLAWWPQIVETARHLRAEGYRSAQPV